MIFKLVRLRREGYQVRIMVLDISAQKFQKQSMKTFILNCVVFTLSYICVLGTDGMIDCSDSECCSHPSCKDHIMCLASNDPVEVLLRKQPPSVTASFYQRVKFLIEENSVQSYAHMDEYSERQERNFNYNSFRFVDYCSYVIIYIQEILSHH